MAETETKAPGPPERSLPRLGAALRRALRRGPALAPERLNLAPRKGRRRRRRAGRPRRGPASGRRSGASAVPGAPGSTGPLRGGAEPRAAGPAVLPARHTAKLSPGSPGAASTGGRAGRPLRAPPGPLLRPPPRRLPPSARLRGPAGRGAPGEVGEAAAGPTSPRSLLAARRRRCGLERLKVSLRPRRGRPRWLTRRRAGREQAGGGRVPAPDRPRQSADPTRRSSSLCSLLLLSSFFLPRGKKSRTISVCARALR